MLDNYLIHSIDDLVDSFTDAEQNLLLLVAQKSDFEHSILSQIPGNICGAIFPQVIYNQKNYDDLIVVVVLGKDTNVTLTSFRDFNKTKINFNANDIIVFLDGLSSDITMFLEDLYESTSIESKIIGAGAGKMTFKQEKVLFDKESIIQDGALLLSDSWDMSFSARHGWEVISDPFIASDVDKNILHSLDYTDAYDVYKKLVEKDSGLFFSDTNFFNLAKSYPLGIAKTGSEILVRDPIATKDNSLVLVGDIEHNSLVYILRGDKEKLISSVKLATEEAIASKEHLQGVFVIDCISRILFLEDDFEKELQVIKQSCANKDINIFGVLSLGEIANTKLSYINFYNKTCVVGAF